MPWPRRLSAEEQKLQQANRDLEFKLLRVREELVASQRHRVGLKVALAVREKKIDTLTRRVDQLLAQNRKLSAEADRLTEMVRFVPPGDAAVMAAE
jgi:predicted  nucleic acid-binding Zn-ribbon protein